MAATAFTDRSNRKENACKKEESIYVLNKEKRIVRVLSIDAPRTSAHPAYGAAYLLIKFFNGRYYG